MEQKLVSLTEVLAPVHNSKNESVCPIEAGKQKQYSMQINGKQKQYSMQVKISFENAKFLCKMSTRIDVHRRNNTHIYH